METFYIDFSCWIIKAKNEGEAVKKAEKLLAQGRAPDICSSEPTGEKDYGETIEFFNAEERQYKEDFNKNQSGA